MIFFKKKLFPKYPSTINGIKQEQNILKRLCIRIWYSQIFRLWFVLFGIWWELPFMILIKKIFNFNTIDLFYGTFFLYWILLVLVSLYDDFDNLIKIGKTPSGKNIEEYISE